jgi:hypothetical protein
MDVDGALDRILIDLLSDRIIERMKVTARSALVLFAGTDLGLAPALEQLGMLRQAGWSLQVVEAADARPLLDGRLASLEVVQAQGSGNDLLANNRLVLVPTLSVTLAAKVALGIADDPLSALLQGALERGSRIVAARDGACPNGRERRARGLLPAPAYRATMSGYLQTLADYGIELSWASRLATAVKGEPLPHALTAPAVSAPPSARSARVFGWQEARAWQGAELHLGRDVLVTTLAAEELRARAIRLVKE